MSPAIQKLRKSGIFRGAKGFASSSFATAECDSVAFASEAADRGVPGLWASSVSEPLNTSPSSAISRMANGQNSLRDNQ